jgi:LytS/YehU family sensor histidine kinase
MGAFDILLNYTNKINAKDESYEILKFKTAIRDSMKAEILAQNIKDLQVKYEVEKTNTENAQLKESQVSTQLKYSRIFGGLIISILLGAIGFGYNNFKNKNRILQSEKRGANLKQKLLRSQINPHFTFNVLSTVQNYIFNNQGEKAANYLAKFARLLRQNLEFTDLKSITLNEEVKFIKSYLELERERKRDLFNYEVKYDGHTNQLNKSIQPLIIQPLIENSIKHGFKNIASGGFIKVLYIAKENIEIQVSDNGCGFGKSLGSKHKSLGLALIKERIEILNKQLNSNQYSMNIDSNENGTTIKVSMPYD